MWTRLGAWAAAALLLTACGNGPGTAPVATETSPQRTVLQYGGGYGGGYDGGYDRGGDRYGRGRRDREIPVVNAYSSSDYKNTRAFNAVDNSTDSFWANAGYQQRRAWVVLQFARVSRIDYVELKTGDLPGVRYRLEVANRRGDWYPVTGWMRADSWDLQRVNVNDSGRYLRVVYENSSRRPVARFWLYAIRAFGPSGGGYGGYGRDDGGDRYSGDWDWLARRGR